MQTPPPQSPSGPPGGPVTETVLLPRHPRSAGRARELFRKQAVLWGLPDEVTDTAVLLLSELVANAYRHAGNPPGRGIGVGWGVTGGRLRLAVSDAGDARPAPRDARADEESGRGLALVVALAADWGTRERPYGIGKEVWVELALGEGELAFTPGVVPSPSG